MTLTITILGCGSSGGVPRIPDDWGACDRTNPRNRRRRCSILVTREGRDGATNVLVDTSPDMREQLIDARTGWLDGVLITHDHADHIHGIDDLRMVAMNGRQRVRVHATQQTMAILHTRFDYCFQTPPGSEYPPILDGAILKPARPVTIDGLGGPVTALPFEQEHGSITSLGFRIGDFAYSSDVNGLSQDSIDLLQGLDLWIVDALRRTPHPSHFSLEETLGWIETLRPRRAILTNMHIDLDYETLRRELPEGVEPAYDGMTVAVAA
jgi:phosphoribosyl 1,2-cyclic phosphate phosphodiesterase